MPAQIRDTDAAFTRRSTVIGQEKNTWPCVIGQNWLCYSVSARPEFLGVIDDPLFENLGVISKFRGSELF